MLYVPLDFENGPAIYALGDLRVCVSANVQNEVSSIKQYAPASIFKIEDPLNLHIQVGDRTTVGNSHTQL